MGQVHPNVKGQLEGGGPGKQAGEGPTARGHGGAQVRWWCRITLLTVQDRPESKIDGETTCFRDLGVGGEGGDGVLPHADVVGKDHRVAGPAPRTPGRGGGMALRRCTDFSAITIFYSEGGGPTDLRRQIIIDLTDRGAPMATGFTRRLRTGWPFGVGKHQILEFGKLLSVTWNSDGRDAPIASRPKLSAR